MFKTLKKKLEQGVAQSQSALKNVIPPNLTKGDGQDDVASTEPSLVDSSFNDSSLVAYSTPLKDSEPSRDIDPAVGQLIDIPLSSDSSPAHVLHDAPRNTRERNPSASSVTSDSALFPPLNLSHTFYVPSDVESVTSDFDSSALTTEGYTKDDLYRLLQKKHVKANKYKSKFKELVAAFKSLTTERDKIKSTLTQSQDRAFRRISELKEQITLDQNAKLDVEQNYQMIIEEKQETIKVLKTQIGLLKEGKDVPDGEISPQPKQPSEGESALQEKITKLEGLLSRCKDTIKNNREKLTAFAKDKAELEELLSKKDAEMLENKDQQDGVVADNTKLRSQIEQARKVIEELESDKVLAIATVKQQMHESLEEKDAELVQVKNTLKERAVELEGARAEVEALRLSGEEKLEKARDIIRRLKEDKRVVTEEADNRILQTEQRIEEEKEALIEELSHAKAAAIALIQEESEKRIIQINESHQQSLAEDNTKWEEKIEQLSLQHQEDLNKKERALEHTLKQKELELAEKLREKEDEMGLAMEERDLQKMAALTQQDNLKDDIIQQMSDLKAENIKLENSITKVKEDYDANILKLNSDHEEIIKNLRVSVDKSEVDYQSTLDDINEEHRKKLETTGAEHEAEVEKLMTQIKQLQESFSANKEMFEAKIHTLLSQGEQSTKTADISAQKVFELEQEIERVKTDLDGSMKQCSDKENELQTEREKLAAFGIEAKKRIRDLKESMDESAKSYEASLAQKEKKFFEELSKKDTEINTLTLKFESEKNRELHSLRSELEKQQGLVHSGKEKMAEKQNQYKEFVKKLKDEHDMMIRSKENEMEQIIKDIQSQQESSILDINMAQKESIDHLVKDWEMKFQKSDDKWRIELEGIEQQYEGINKDLEKQVSDLKEKLDIELHERSKVEKKYKDITEMLEALNLKNRELENSKIADEAKIKEMNEDSEKLSRAAAESQSDEVKELHKQLAASEELVAQKDDRLVEMSQSQSDELKELNARLFEYQEQLTIKAEEIDHVRKHNEEFQTQLDLLKAEHAKEVLQLNESHTEYLGEIEVAIANKVSAEVVEKYEVELSEKNEELNRNGALIEELKEAIIIRDKEIESIQVDFQQYQSDFAAKEKEHYELSELYKNIFNERDTFNHKIVEMTEQLNQAKLTLNEREQTIVEVNDVVRRLENDKITLNEKISFFDSENSNKNEKFEQLSDSLQHLRADIDDKNKTCGELEKQLGDVTLKHDSMKAESIEKLNEVQERIDELVKQNSEIKNELSAKEELWKDSLQKTENEYKQMESKLSIEISSLQDDNKVLLIKVDELVAQEKTMKGMLEEQEQLKQQTEYDFDKQINNMKVENATLLGKNDNDITLLTEKLSQFEFNDGQLRDELVIVKQNYEVQGKTLVEKEAACLKLQDRFDKLKVKAQTTIEKYKKEKEEIEKTLLDEKNQQQSGVKSLTNQLEDQKEHQEKLVKKLEEQKQEKIEMEKNFEAQFDSLKEERNKVEEDLKDCLACVTAEKDDLDKKLKDMLDTMQKDRNDALDTQQNDYVEKTKLLKMKFKEKMTEIHGNMEILSKDRDELQEKLKVAEDKRDVQLNEYRKLVEDIKLESEKQAISFSEEKSQLLQNIEIKERDLKVHEELLQQSVTSSKHDAEKQISKISEKHLEQEREIENIWTKKVNDIREQYDKEIEDLHNNNKNLNENLDKFRCELEEAMNKHKNDILDKDTKLKELESKLKFTDNETQCMIDKLNTANAQVLKHEEIEKMTDDKIEALEKNIEELQHELDIRKEKIEIVTEELSHVNTVRDEKQNLEEASRGLEKAVVDKDNEIASLKAELQSAIEEQNKLNSDIDRVVLESKTKAEELQRLVHETEEKQGLVLENLQQKMSADNDNKVAEYKRKAEAYLSQMKKQFFSEKENAVAVLEGRISEFETNIEILNSDNTKLKADSDNLKSIHEKNLDELKNEHLVILEEKDAEILDYKNRLLSNETGNTEMLNEIDMLKREKSVLNKALVDLESVSEKHVKKLESTVGELEKEKEDLNTSFTELKLTTSVEKTTNKENFNKDLQEARENYEQKVNEMNAEHSAKVKQLVKEFNVKLEEKDREFQDHLASVSDKTQKNSDRLFSESKQQMSELYKDLHDKEEHIENLLEEHRTVLQTKDNELQQKTSDYESKITALRDELQQLSTTHDKQVKVIEDRVDNELEKRVEERMQRSLDSHNTEIKALTEEWQQERRTPRLPMEDLLPTSSQKLLTETERAIAAIQTNSVNSEGVKATILDLTRRQQQLTSQYELELAELRGQQEMTQGKKPLVASPGDRDVFSLYDKEPAAEIQNLELHNLDLQEHVNQLTSELERCKNKQSMLQDYINGLEGPNLNPHVIHPEIERVSSIQPPFIMGPLLSEPTEMEYLRNVLYEYMMGRQTKTLAKVIATVVRFSDDQMRRVLERENQVMP